MARWTGFDVDLCRAIAAAVFGDPDKIEFRSLRGEARFASLQTGAVDVLTRNGAWTQRRDTLYGANYVAPTFFDGQAFMVPQSLGVVSAYELDNVSVCVIDGGDELDRMQEFFFTNQATYTEVLYEDARGPRRRLSRRALPGRLGLGPAVAGHPPRPARAGQPPHPARAHLQGTARPGGARRATINGSTSSNGRSIRLINAEEVGVTSLNIESLSAARTPAVRRIARARGRFRHRRWASRPNFMSNVIRAVGNYAELYDRHFGPQTGAALLRGQNALWSNGGLLYAPPDPLADSIRKQQAYAPVLLAFILDLAELSGPISRVLRTCVPPQGCRSTDRRCAPAAPGPDPSAA